ncbi:MAG: hypothetical protein ABJB66_09410 [Gemmatimonadaceae bacterium]
MLTTATAADRSFCSQGNPAGFALSQLISVIEVAPNGDSLLLYGKQRDTTVARPLLRPRIREVDPRSVILVHFNSLPINCAPVFAVQMRGAVFANSTKRPLEIPRYFEAGVAQATPQSRTMLLARGKALLMPAGVEALSLLSSTFVVVASASRDSSRRSSLLAAGASLDALRISRRTLLELRDRQTIQARTQISDPVADSVRALDSILAANADTLAKQQKLTEQLQAADLAATLAADSAKNIAAYKRALVQLSNAPIVKDVVKGLLGDSYRGVRREIATRKDIDPVVLEMQLSLLKNSLDVAQTLGQSSSKSLDSLTSTFSELQSNLRVLIKLAEIFAPFEGLQDFLLPDANITLSGSSVSEGERISLSIDLVSDDNAILDSKVLTYNVIRVGYVVKNIRDVAFLVNRRIRHQADRVESIQAIRNSFVSTASIGDRLVYDGLSRQATLASAEHFTPAPGVVLEALIRPRPGSGGWGNFLLPVRYLGLSVGLSVSLVQFSDEQLEVKVPTFEELKKLDGQKAAIDSAFALGAVSFTKNELGIAPAIHLGLFDGALSVAYGQNLRSSRSAGFVAVGFSFMGLTQAGQKLWQQLAGEK